MAIQIAIGYEGFEEIRKSGLYYVDKTELLYDLVSRTKNKVTLFTRPRRFGKTLNIHYGIASSRNRQRSGNCETMYLI